MPTAGVTTDITIESVSGTPKLGFMLARKRRGLRDWQIRDAETIQPRVLSMGELTQAELPPQLELVWYEDKWDGIGGDLHRTDPNRLGGSTRKIDTSRDGKIRMTRDLRATTVDVVPTGSVYDASGFAIVEPDTTGNPIIWAFIGRSVYSWSHANNNWVQGTNPQAQDCIYKNGAQFGIKTYAPAWHRTLEWYPFPYIYKSSSDANWVLSTLAQGKFKYFTKTRNAAGDQIFWGGFNVYDSTIDLNAAMSDTTGTTATVTPDPTTLIAVNDIVLIDTEKMLVTARSATTLTVVRGYDSSTAATHANGAQIDIYAPHAIRSSSDPTNAGSWGSRVSIGADDHPITGLVANGDSLLICKTNGVWAYYPDGSFENLTPDLEQQRNTDNFQGAYVWNGHILLPLGAGGMLDLSHEVLNDVSLKNYMPKETALHGRVVAIHGDARTLYILVAQTGSTRYHLLAGIFNQDFQWHHAATLPYTTGTVLNHAAIMVDGSDTESLTGNTNAKHNRVWTGIRGSGATTDAERLPNYLPFGVIDADENDGFSNDTDVEAITGKYDANLPRVDKQAARIEIESENLAAARTLEVFYRLDNATAWTSLGTLNTSTAFQTISFADGTTYKVMELRFLLTRTGAVASTNDMAVLSFKLVSQLRPTAIKTIPLTVYLADEQQLLNGAIRSSIKGDLSQLRTWNGQAAEVILRTPPEYGAARNCVFLPGTLVEREVAHEYGRRTELECSFMLAEV